MPTSRPHVVTFAISGPITRADLPGLCDRVCAILGRSGATVVCPIAVSDLPGLCERVCGLLDRSRPDVALCDVTGVEPDAVTVDALARLQLAACRLGCRIVLRNASEPLNEVVELMGLSDVLSERRSPAADRSAGTAARRRGRT